MGKQFPLAGVLRPRVLMVDDHPENLLVFRAAFSRHIDVLTAESAAEGLDLLEAEEIQIVISDQKMPGMAGNAFLAEVRRRWPDTIRMLVSAYTNFDDVVAAINEGQVHRFICKPWDAEDLLSTLFSAGNLYWKVKENNLLREELLHRERLSAVGRTTSGLVHELANVGTILNVVEDSLRDLWNEEEVVPPELDLLSQGIAKFTVLTETLRLYSKGEDQLHVEQEIADLVVIVSGALELLKLFPQYRNLRKIDFDPPNKAIYAWVDMRKIQQVVLNLVKNAAEACEYGKGVVRIELGSAADETFFKVRDNGPGIPAAVTDRIWEGFYTTKGRQGTGLGLWMCRKIIEAHGGTISVSNNRDAYDSGSEVPEPDCEDRMRGCTFYVTLAASERPADA